MKTQNDVSEEGGINIPGRHLKSKTKTAKVEAVMPLAVHVTIFVVFNLVLFSTLSLLVVHEYHRHLICLAFPFSHLSI